MTAHRVRRVLAAVLVVPLLLALVGSAAAPSVGGCSCMPGELVTIETSLWYDDGGGAAWHDISADVRNTPVHISRGAPNEANPWMASPGKLSLQLNQGRSKVQPGLVGRYDPDNPRSDLVGLIGDYTPIRVRAALGANPLTTRCVMEMVDWSPQWTPAEEADLWVSATAAGVFRRLGVPGKPLWTTLYRYIPGTDPLAYYPGQDGRNRLAPRPVVGPPMVAGVIGTNGEAPPRMGAGTLAPHLPVAMRMDVPEGVLGGFVRASGLGGTSTTWTFEAIYRYESGSGSIAWRVRDENDGNNLQALLAVDADSAGTPVLIRITDFGPPAVTLAEGTSDSNVLLDGKMHHLSMRVSPGSFTLYVDGVELPLSTNSFTGSFVPQTLAPSWSFGGPLDTGHWVVWDGNAPSVADTVDAAFGHPGEPAGRRVERLCSEQSVPFASMGDLDATMPMGPQRPDEFLRLLSEAGKAEAAGGPAPVVQEQRDERGVLFRTRRNLYTS